MRKINIDKSWRFGHGLYGGLASFFGSDSSVEVNLPHDYMIAENVSETAPAGPASGFYTAGVAYYTKLLFLPDEWKDQEIYLNFDGVMMNATVDINGCKAAMQHYGYAPFFVNITPYVYFGKENRITVTVNPSMQPNSRWYSGAGIFRSVELLHMPKLHIAPNGIFGYTSQIEYDTQGHPLTAFLKTEVTVENHTLENKLVNVEVFLTPDGTDTPVICRSQKIQVNPASSETARLSVVLDQPQLWNADSPDLYQLHARVTELGTFITHFVPSETQLSDEASVLFGIRTVTVDSRHGLRINGKTTKLKGGCLHHDNGILGAVSLYDAEYRKLSRLKEIGFNAIRTTHNIPSSVFLEACDRLGLFVFAEAFDAWGIMKQPGDYNLFFDTDWKQDLRAFLTRDRSHPSIIIWSTGNEITERGGLNNGYSLAAQLADFTHALDPSRPVSNGICSFWSGLDDQLTAEYLQKVIAEMNGSAQSVQNVDLDSDDLLWENYTEPFTNGLDLVGYNYMEDKYLKDHELYPDRVILGSENFPKEIGKNWPMVERLPYVVGDFTWTACDYIGEAGIGKSVFVEKEDPRLKMGSMALASHTSGFPWRLANDADLSITGELLPQGAYRSIVWGSKETALYSYAPETFDKQEIISRWGFTAAQKNWSWKNADGKPMKVVVFSNADEVVLLLNEHIVGTLHQGESLAVENLPKSFVFDVVYEPGTLTAISYSAGKELSRDSLTTVGPPAAIRLLSESDQLTANGHDLAYLSVEIVDSLGNIIPDGTVPVSVSISGSGELLGFGSSNPITSENYTSGCFTTYRGKALAIVRSAYETGSVLLEACADGFPTAVLSLPVI